MAAKFGLFVDEDHSKLPTLYWFPKLHKRPYKSRLIAYSSACTNAEVSILLTSCLIAIKNHVIIQLMHSFEVDIRICQPKKSDVHRGEAEVNITFEGWLILMLTEKECTNCFVI